MIIFVILGIAALVTFFWQRIVDLFRGTVLPWTRAHFPKFADRMADVMNWVDGHMVIARDTIQRFRNQYKAMVLQHFTKYQEQQGQIVQQDEVHIRSALDEVEVLTRESVAIAPSDLPLEIFKELKMNGVAMIDAREAVINRIDSRAHELGMELEASA